MRPDSSQKIWVWDWALLPGWVALAWHRGRGDIFLIAKGTAASVPSSLGHRATWWHRGGKAHLILTWLWSKVPRRLDVTSPKGRKIRKLALIFKVWIAFHYMSVHKWTSFPTVKCLRPFVFHFVFSFFHNVCNTVVNTCSKMLIFDC